MIIANQNPRRIEAPFPLSVCVSAPVLIERKRADLPAMRIGPKEGPGLLPGCRPSFLFYYLLPVEISTGRPFEAWPFRAKKNHEHQAAFYRQTFVAIQELW
jgi:hypothetical protein